MYFFPFLFLLFRILLLPRLLCRMSEERSEPSDKKPPEKKKTCLGCFFISSHRNRSSCYLTWAIVLFTTTVIIMREKKNFKLFTAISLRPLSSTLHIHQQTLSLPLSHVNTKLIDANALWCILPPGFSILFNAQFYNVAFNQSGNYCTVGRRWIRCHGWVERSNELMLSPFGSSR